MSAIHSEILDTEHFSCTFNRAFFSSAEVQELLDADAEKLFVRPESLKISEEKRSYHLQIGGASYFAREFLLPPVREGWIGYWDTPLVRQLYFACERLKKAQTPATEPVLAAISKKAPRQILVTQYYQNNGTLTEKLKNTHDEERRGYIAVLAEFLSHLQERRLYIPDFSTDHLLVCPVSSKERNAFRLSPRGPVLIKYAFNRRFYARMIADACINLYSLLTPEERMFLFISCFDMALKRNIFSRPSQQTKFIHSVTKQVKRLRAPHTQT